VAVRRRLFYANLSYPSSSVLFSLHTGAGKTSTISLLTGLFPPTSGDASIYGHSIVDETAHARGSIGICPQQNVLFSSLTVLEHILFFNRIKGVQCTEVQAKTHAQEIGLGEFLYTTSSALSGGNKRKLSVAVALCGDPKFLVLDEPTCGKRPWATNLYRRQKIAVLAFLSPRIAHRFVNHKVWILVLVAASGRF
jgi:ABC-type multidrug transport system ATPase subunit